MKTLFPVLIFSVIYSITCGYGSLQTSSIHLRSYPKKFDSILHRHLNILNRRYFKPTITEVTKRVNTDKLYTAFPPIPENRKKLNYPESPYFSLGSNINENKVRVKKVLPQYPFKQSIRKKRAITKNTTKKPTNTLDADEDKKTTKHKRGKAKPTTKHKRGKTTKPTTKHKRGKTTKPTTKHKKEKTSKTTTKKRGKTTKPPTTKKPKKLSKKAELQSLRRRSELENGTRRLVAALDTSIDEYPYTVSIQKDGEHWCAGALLNQRLVITTANCVWKSLYYSRMRVRAGSRYTDRGGQLAKIQEVMKHPKWSLRKSPDNDVALLLLDRFFKFSDSCHGVDLPNRLMLPVFDDAWVTSWGAERRDGIYEKKEMTLQVYHARFIERDKCNNVTTRFGVSVSPNFICLAQTGRRAPCTRDTGAPAVSDGVLWGMASWGIRKLCGTERFPAMFSYTGSMSNMDFISAATTALMSEQRVYPFPGRFELKPPASAAPVLSLG